MKVPPKKKSENTAPDASDASELATSVNSPTTDEVDENASEGETPPAVPAPPTPPTPPTPPPSTVATNPSKAAEPPEARKPVAPLKKEQFYVKLIQDHNCSIGGVSYKFKAGVRVGVPFNVKCVLSRANLLRG